MEVRNTSEKVEKTQAKLKKHDEDAMLCNTGSQTDAGSSQKHFLLFRVLLNVEIDLNFPQKCVFFSLVKKKFRFPVKIILN